MGWTDANEENNIKHQEEKKIKNLSRNILIAIVFLIIVIIAIIGVLIVNVEKTSFEITVDTKQESISKSKLLIKQGDVTYVNIEEFASLVGYEFHNNEEYKAFTKEADKCYVKGNEETTTFYINENKIYKLPVNDVISDYQEFNVEDAIIKIDEKPYASVNTIKEAFNVEISDEEKEFSIYTLDFLIDIYDKRVQNWGYTSILEQNFENKKLLLKGYLIVKKENGLYKIIDLENKEEMVSDKYNQIQFIEYKEEFLVTNSLEKVGIINLDGTVKIEPLYDSIQIFDASEETYLIKEKEKVGIVKAGNAIILQPEYDSIGVSINDYPDEKNSCYILNTLIPVCKDGKWGATDKQGKTIISIEYDGLGSAKTVVNSNEESGYNNNITSQVENVNVQISNNTITSQTGNNNDDKAPILSISECNGIVVKKNNKYGIVNVDGNLMVQIAVDNIYSKKQADDTLQYYMLYNGSEINIIDSLKAAGLIKENTEETIKKNNENTNSIQNTVTNTTSRRNSKLKINSNLLIL